MTQQKHSFLNNFAGAWIFYSIFPKLPFIEPKFKNIAQFAPLIGILLGLIQGSIYLIFQAFSWPIYASTALCIASGYLVTGGLHIDGLMDTVDGIYAGRKKMLKAIKDSRVGSFGVQSLIFISLFQYASIANINNEIIYVLPICLFWGRFSTLVYIENFNYLTFKKKSLSHKKYWRGFFKESLISSLLFFSATSYLFFSFSSYLDLIRILIPIILGLFFSFQIPNLLGKKVSGFNGDTLGASVVIVETIMLFTYAIFL